MAENPESTEIPLFTPVKAARKPNQLDATSVRDVTAEGESIGVRAKDARQLIAHLHKGFHWNTFERLRANLDLSQSELCRIVDVNIRTVNRRKLERRFHTDESERILRVARLLESAMALFKDKPRTLTWLKTSKKALGGKSPLDYADTSVGIREVEE